MFASTNPYTQNHLADYPLLDDKGIENALASSALAFQTWRNTTLQQRADLLYRVADLMLQKRDALATLMCQEMGKPISQALPEIEKSAWVCQYYAQNTHLLLPDAVPIDGAEHSKVVYQPLGAILLIMPWNFPFWQVFRCAAPVLLAGNSILLKHAPNVGGCALAIEQLFKEAQAPDGLFQNLFIGTDSVPRLLQNPVVQGVSLTGSVQAGAAVGALAGQNLKKAVLELGGSDAFVVLEDADLQKAVETALFSRLQNNGQTCIAAKRFILLPKIADDFLQLLLAGIKKWTLGNPLHTDTKIGPMARPDLVQSLQNQVNETIAQGANALLQGGHVAGSQFFSPTVLTHIPATAPAYSQELFGPVFSVFMAQNEQEALHIANDTVFGLGASIWSKDTEKAHRWALQLQSGVVAVNQLVRSDPRFPFGGIKQSGIGRELGSIGLKEFTNIKTIFAD